MAALLSLAVNHHVTDEKFLAVPPSPPQSPPNSSPSSPPSSLRTGAMRLASLDADVPCLYGSTEHPAVKKRRKQARPVFNADVAREVAMEDDDDDNVDDKEKEVARIMREAIGSSDFVPRRNEPNLHDAEKGQVNYLKSVKLEETGNEYERKLPELIPISGCKFSVESNSSPKLRSPECAPDDRDIPLFLRHGNDKENDVISSLVSKITNPTSSMNNSPFPFASLSKFGGLPIPSPFPSGLSSSPGGGLVLPNGGSPLRGDGTPVRDAGCRDDDLPSSDGELDVSDGLMMGEGGGQAEVCPQCKKVFKRRVYLQRHMAREHWSLAKIFKCDKCTYETKHQSNLLVHRRTHTGERPYHCGACGQRYTQGHLLKAHIRSRHNADMRFYNMDKRIDSVRCRRLMVNQKHTAGLLAASTMVGGATGGVLGKEDRIKFLLQAAENGRLLGGGGPHGSGGMMGGGGLLGGNGILGNTSLMGGNSLMSGISGGGLMNGAGLLGVNPMFDDGNASPFSLGGRFLPGSDRKPDIFSGGSTNGGSPMSGAGAKEDRIRYLLQAAEAVQHRSSSPALPPHSQAASIQQASTSSQNLFMQTNSALTQYVNALSACLPSGMRPLFWPPPPPLSLPGSIGSTTTTGTPSMHGSRFASSSESIRHSALLSTLAGSGGGDLRGGVDSLVANSMLTSMLAKLSEQSKPLLSSSRDEQKRVGGMDVDAMMPQDLTMGSRYTTPDRSAMRADAMLLADEKKLISSPRPTRSASPSSVNYGEQATDFSVRWKQAQRVERVLSDDLKREGSSPGGASATLTASPSPAESMEEFSSSSAYARGPANLMASYPDSPLVTIDRLNVKRESKMELDAGTHPDSDESKGNVVKSGSDEKRGISGDACRKSGVVSSVCCPGDAACMHLAQLKALRRNVYRMLRVFAPYLEVGGDEDCEGDAIDEFLHEVIYSKIDDASN